MYKILSVCVIDMTGLRGINLDSLEAHYRHLICDGKCYSNDTKPIQNVLNILKKIDSSSSFRLETRDSQPFDSRSFSWNNERLFVDYVFSSRGILTTVLSNLEKQFQLSGYKPVWLDFGHRYVGLLNRNRCKMSYTKNKGSIAYEMSKVQSGYKSKKWN